MVEAESKENGGKSMSRKEEYSVPRGVGPAMKEHFRHALKNWRVDNGLTQREMAKKLGIHFSLFSHWENGIRFPSDEALAAIRKLTGSSLEELLGEDVRVPFVELPIIGEVSAGQSRDYEVDQVLLYTRGVKLFETPWAIFHQFSKAGATVEILRVVGDKLAPTLNKGDLVFVERTDAARKGDYVVTETDAGMFLRVLGERGGERFFAGLPTIQHEVAPEAIRRKTLPIYGVARGRFGPL